MEGNKKTSRQTSLAQKGRKSSLKRQNAEHKEEKTLHKKYIYNIIQVKINQNLKKASTVHMRVCVCVLNVSVCNCPTDY